jgi:transcriptional regulator with XRE-family HTH domain
MNKKLKAQIILQYGSQRNFAFKLGEDESLVSKIVGGWRSPDPVKKARWAQALKCSVDDIFPAESARRVYS